MACSSHKNGIARRICERIGQLVNSKRSFRNPQWMLPLLGLVSLIWFLLRVISKPSRAGYPCMRVAAPMASSFVVWLLGLGGSAVVLKKVRSRAIERRWAQAAACVGLAVAVAWIGMTGPVGTTGGAVLSADPANDPIGVARGFNPGRVTWVHDPNATDWNWDGTEYWWQGSHTDQAVVDQMVSKAVRWLAGKPTEAEAWEALFHHFNRERGKGDVGYQPGEKFYIKMNLTNCNCTGNTSVTSRDLRPSREHRIDTSPHVIKALLKQLVNVVGVAQSDIYVGDTVSFFPNQYYEILVGDFPNVNYIDHFGGSGRYGVSHSGVPFYWSTTAADGKVQDYLPVCVAQAAYVINVPVLKGHGWGGITIAAKNHYGSMIRSPVGWEWGGTYNYYGMHDNLAYPLPGRGYYRPNVDLMGHMELGGKTVLYLVDALYCGYYWEGNPHKWNMAPFNGDWPSSVFASQDGVAIDSVGYDFLNQEWPEVVSGGSLYPEAFEGAAQDYLHEAALADSPPSGTFYDPENDGVRMKSLGTHEHWNNATDKLYTRNLGTGDGIELITSDPLASQNTNTPDISVSPSTHDFGEKGIGTTNHVFCEVTISNDGTFALNTSDMTLSDITNFYLNVNAGSNPCGGTATAINPGERCSVYVVFTPQIAGILNTTLSIDSDDPDSPSVDVSFVGTALSTVGGETSAGGGGCSIVGVKMSIEDTLAGYGLLIVAGVLWGIRKRRRRSL